MKRLVMFSGACVLVAGVCAVWFGQRRRLQAQEQSMRLQTWEAEGGGLREKTSEPDPADIAYR